MKVLLLLLVFGIGFAVDFLISGNIYTSLVTSLIVSIVLVVAYFRNTKQKLAEFIIGLLFLIMLILLLALANVANAGEYTVKTINYHDMSSDELFRMEAMRGLQFDYQHNPESLYLFASHAEGTVYTKSPAYKLKIQTLGFGKKGKFSWGNLYGQAGYSFVDNSFNGRHKCLAIHCEGLYSGNWGKWGDIIDLSKLTLNEYEVNTSDGYSIAAGGELVHNLSKKWAGLSDINMVFGLEYNFISFKTQISAMAPELDYDNTGQRLETAYKGVGVVGLYLGLNAEF